MVWVKNDWIERYIFKFSHLLWHFFSSEKDFLVFYPFFTKFYTEATVQFSFGKFKKIPNVKITDSNVCLIKNVHIINYDGKKSHGFSHRRSF